MNHIFREFIEGGGPGPMVIAFVCVLALTTTARSQSPEPFSSRHFEIHRLADGVYAAIHTVGGHAICNAGIVDLGDRTIVFDTFLSPEAARDLKRAAESYTSRAVSFVVNSHDHNDHIRGNTVFRPGAEIISTEQVRLSILENEPETIASEKEVVPARLQALRKQLDTAKAESARREVIMWLGYYEAMQESHEELITTPPTITFDSVLTIYGSRRTATLLCMGRGHTSSDVILYLPEEKILFAGDLVFHQMHPWLADGDPDAWREALISLKELHPVTVVPGHGLPGNAGIVDSMDVYLAALDELARSVVQEGLEDREHPEVPARFRTWSFPHFYAPNLEFMIKRISD